MKQDRRGSWYLLTGAVLGIAMGLLYSWIISPVEYVDAPPYALRADFKDEYRALVAAAYLYSGDLLRAEDRLKQLQDENTAQNLAMQAQQALAEGRPEAEVRALGLLAMALGKGVTPPAPGTTPLQESSAGSPTSAVTPTPLLLPPILESTTSPPASPPGPTESIQFPTNTETPLPMVAESGNPGVEYLLVETLLVCNPDQVQPLVQVEVRDAAGQPVPSVELVVTWEGGEDHFFTGLKPELSLGYADFQMTPGVVYTLHLAEGGQPTSALSAAECLAEDESRYWGSWMLTFEQP